MVKKHLAVFFTALVIFVVGAAGQAQAHGLYGSRVEEGAVVLYFEYSDSTPLAYGQVSLFSPSDHNIEYQKGRSDQNGFFAFRPNEAGDWKAEIEDGQGHKTHVTVSVPQNFIAGGQAKSAAPAASEVKEAGSPSEAHKPGPLTIGLGLSIILNLFLLGLCLKKGRRPGRGD